MKLNKDQNLTVRSMGKEFKLTAVFHDADESNKYMETHPDEAVIAYFDPYVFLASKYEAKETVSAPKTPLRCLCDHDMRFLHSWTFQNAASLPCQADIWECNICERIATVYYGADGEGMARWFRFEKRTVLGAIQQNSPPTV